MEIGGVKLKSNILLAPVAGFSDVGFRSLCARYGAGMTCTEMVSAKGLCYGNRGTEELLRTTADASPVAVQLFGCDPEFMRKAATDERLSKFDIIDINMGCPVKKIVSNGEGSALMENPSLITELVQAARESKKPVTVKIRAGVEEGKPLAVEAALAAEKGGAAAVAVHPRYREQFYSGVADHTLTRAVKEAVKIPVIASGDVVETESLKRVLDESGADGVMLARGALGKPWLFSELLGVAYQFDTKKAVEEHISILRETFPDRVVANMMKLHLCHYAKNTSSVKAVRKAISGTLTISDLMAIVDEYL